MRTIRKTPIRKPAVVLPPDIECKGKVPNIIATGTPKPGRMNGLEAKHAGELEQRRMKGEVLYWMFESFKIKLAEGCWYTPDFFVMLKSGEIEFHETKGYFRDDAKVKVKVAASLFPFRFFLYHQDGRIEEVKGG